jgi:hypothetical protein
MVNSQNASICEKNKMKGNLIMSKAKQFIKKNWELMACATICSLTLIGGISVNVDAETTETETDVSETTTTSVVTMESTEATTTTEHYTTPATCTTTTTSHYKPHGDIVEYQVGTEVIDTEEGEIIAYVILGTTENGEVIIPEETEEGIDETETESTTTTTTDTVTTTTCTTTEVVTTETETETDDIKEDEDTADYPISESEYILLCNCVGHEAGANNIPVTEKAKVVEVIMNRVYDSRWPNNVYDVITQPYQFTGSSSYAYLDDYSWEVSDMVREAVDLYFEDPDQFDHGYTGFYGDGYQNHFS